MRGKVTDQDLTNYALNELSAEERLYVESMLGVSEECRHDVYQMLELSEMLKDGFEAREEAADLLLNHEQRNRVLTVPRFHWRGFFQRAAAIALLAAGAGYGLTRDDIWRRGSDNFTAVKETLSEIGDADIARTTDQYLQNLLKAGAPTDDWQLVQGPAVPSECTPPGMPGIIAEMPEPSAM